jgi:hypothetical protein
MNVFLPLMKSCPLISQNIWAIRLSSNSFFAAAFFCLSVRITAGAATLLVVLAVVVLGLVTTVGIIAAATQLVVLAVAVITVGVKMARGKSST